MSAGPHQPATSSSENLWSLAAARLSNKDKASLDSDLTVKLDDLLSAVESKRQECERRQWTVKKVVLRDVFTKIVKWIEKFVEMGDVAVQYDPGHAALPWAAIRFLLKVSVRDVERYTTIIEGTETMANIITQYRIVERLYLKTEYEATIQLKENVINLYVQVLKFLIKAKRFYIKNTALRALKSLADFDDSFQGYIDKALEKDRETKTHTALIDAQIQQSFKEELVALSKVEKDNYERLKRILNDLQKPIDRIEKRLQELQDGLSEAERIKILYWLSPLPYEQYHNQSKRDVMPGTGGWFLNDDQLLAWRRSSSSSIMWLRGIAGSGKSKLISIYLEQQLNEFRENRNPNPVYFYCARNVAEPERAKADAILRSLVRQLSCQKPGRAILEPVRTAYKEREQSAFAAGPLTVEESTDLIIRLSKLWGLTTIVLDALDECDQTLRDDLLEALTKIVQNSDGLVKILISSRDERDIACHLAACLNLEIKATKNQADISAFVDSEVDKMIRGKKFLLGKVPEDLRQETKNILCEKAQGMFRWVSLQLQYLRGLRLEVSFRDRLGKLPSDLRKTYEETLNQKLDSFEKVERSVTEGVFSLLLCLQDPLPTNEFVEALSCCTDKQIGLDVENVLDLCSNFVVIDNELDVFRFAHLSVREFLENRDGYDSARNDALAAECCLRYLSGNTVMEMVPIFAKFEIIVTFHEYACLYWQFHLYESKNHRLSFPLEALARNFMMDGQREASPAFTCWNEAIINTIHPNRMYRLLFNRTYRKVRETLSQPADCIFTAARYGFSDLLELRIKLDATTLEKQYIYGGVTAFSLACEYGFTTTAQILIDNGANIDPKGPRGLTPLMSAIIHGRTETVKFLLSRGANMYPGGIEGTGPLRFAIRPNEMNIFRLLMENGADPEREHFMGITPLDSAAAEGNEEAVKLLLEKSPSIESSAKFLWQRVTQMQNAMRCRGEIGLRDFLSDWPKNAQATQHLGAVLCKAAERQDEACVGLLLASGANANSVHDQKSVLSHSCAGLRKHRRNTDCLKVMKILLDYGANPNERWGTIILACASRYDSLGAMHLLVDAGADVNPDGPIEASPLWYAVFSGSVRAVKFLLERKANVTEIATLFFAGNKCFMGWLNKREVKEIGAVLRAYGAKHGYEWALQHQVTQLTPNPHSSQESLVSSDEDSQD